MADDSGSPELEHESEAGTTHGTDLDASLWEQLGIDPSAATPAPPDDVWADAVRVATDPSTPPVDDDLVPTDDDATEIVTDDDATLVVAPDPDEDPARNDLDTGDHDAEDGEFEPDDAGTTDRDDAGPGSTGSDPTGSGGGTDADVHLDDGPFDTGAVDTGYLEPGDHDTGSDTDF